MKKHSAGGGRRPRSGIQRVHPKYLSERFTRGQLLKGSFTLAGGIALTPLLGACGDGEGQGELAVGDEQVTGDYWVLNSWPNDVIEDIIASFNEENPNIEIEPIYNGEDYPDLIQTLQASIAGGNAPTSLTIGYANIRYVAENIPHLTIEEVAERIGNGQGQQWLEENFEEDILDLGRVDGVLHFLPYSLSAPWINYNLEAFEQAGIESPPRTWAEVRDYARRLTEETDMIGLGIWDTGGEIWTHQALMESNGARLVTETDQGIRCGADSPEAIEAMQVLADMVLEDETAYFDPDQVPDDFTSGRAAMTLITSSYLGRIRDAAQFEFGSAPFPTFGDKPRRVAVGGNVLGIFAEEEEEQAAAWQLIQHLVSPEAITIWDEALGYFPPQEEVSQDPQYLGEFFDDPQAAPAVEQRPDLVPWASFPGSNGLEASRLLRDMLDRIYSGSQEVTESLEETTQRVNELISE